MNPIGRRFFLFATGVLVLTGPTMAGIPEQTTEFEVASVKVNKSGPGSSNWEDGHGKVSFTNVTMATLVKFAFGIKDYELSGPSWFDADRYDINAKGPDGTLDKDLPVMMQALLKERFGMVFHREVKEVSVFSLVVDKGGFKGKAATDDSAVGLGGGIGIGSGSGGTPSPVSTMSSTGTMPRFAESLARNRDVNRPVIDKTGLTGRYEMSLRYLPFSNQATGDPAPSIFQALQEQLGLRLEPDKGQIEVVVIERMEKVPIQQ